MDTGSKPGVVGVFNAEKKHGSCFAGWNLSKFSQASLIVHTTQEAEKVIAADNRK